MHESKKRRKYDATFKGEVLRMVNSGQSVSYIAEALGISENIIYTWKSKNKVGKEKSVSQSDLSVENQQLKNLVRQLETELEILKKALRTSRRAFSAGLPQPRELNVLYELIDTLSGEFAISTLCLVLKASRTAYYRYKRGGSYQLTARREEKRLLVEKVFGVHKRRYGSRRIVAELQQSGHSIGRYKVRSLMKYSGLRPIQPKSLVPRATGRTTIGATGTTCCWVSHPRPRPDLSERH